MGRFVRELSWCPALFHINIRSGESTSEGFRNRLTQCLFKKTTFMVHLQAPFMFVGLPSFKNGGHK